jgi:hypothetical protein
MLFRLSGWPLPDTASRSLQVPCKPADRRWDEVPWTGVLQALRPGRLTGSGHAPADRFVMGLLRACADVVLIGAGALTLTTAEPSGD